MYPPLSHPPKGHPPPTIHWWFPKVITGLVAPSALGNFHTKPAPTPHIPRWALLHPVLYPSVGNGPKMTYTQVLPAANGRGSLEDNLRNNGGRGRVAGSLVGWVGSLVREGSGGEGKLGESGRKDQAGKVREGRPGTGGQAGK
eukprot:157602-Chlamydomonas_euryale.AAC.1